MKPDWNSPLGKELMTWSIVVMMVGVAFILGWALLNYTVLTVICIGSLAAVCLLIQLIKVIVDHWTEVLTDELLYQLKKKKDNAWEAQNINKRKEGRK